MQKIKIFLTNFILLFTAISAISQTNLPNVATLYDFQNNSMHPRYLFFHKNDSTTIVMGNINLNELNLVKLNNRTYEGKINVKIILYQSIENLTVVDSVRKELTFNYANSTQSIIISFDLHTNVQNAAAIIITQDMYNKKRVLNFLPFDKSQTSEQNFLLLDSASNTPVFLNFVKPNKKYYINSRFRESKYVVAKYEIDSTFPTAIGGSQFTFEDLKVLTYDTVLSNQYLKFKDSAIYKISLLSNDSDCFYVLNYGKSFPEFLDANDMIEPLKYISSSTEFDKLNSEINKKVAIDYFWLTRNKDFNTARGLIKTYYNRAFYANIYFSSTKPGWETDRGMVFMIFGQPSIVNILDNSEIWTYYNPYNYKKLTVTFTKQKTNNLTYDLILDRNSELFQYWQNSLKSWNSGVLFKF